MINIAANFSQWRLLFGIIVLATGALICFAPVQVQADDESMWMPDVSGLLQPRFSVIKNTGFATEDQNGFSIERARLQFSKDLSIDAVTGTLFYEIEVELSTGTLSVRDLVVGYQPLAELGFQVGQDKVPFSYSLMSSAGKLLFADRHQAERLTYGRDRGVQLQGHFSLDNLIAEDRPFILGYKLGVFNGEGSAARNQNERFVYAGRILIEPMGSLGASAEGDLDPCNGQWRSGCTSSRPLRLGLGASLAHDPSVGKGISPKDLGRKETRYALEAHMKVAGLALHGEYLSAHATSIAADGGIDRRSYYAAIAYNPAAVNWLEPAVRYEFIDIDESEDNTVRDPGMVEFQSRRLITAGINFYLYQHKAKLSVNYILTDLQEGVKESPQGDPLFGDAVVTQLQVAF